ncbi:hypothetical protein [Pseudoroseomonas ludipueritiae]|uniref:Uncharacterized protein n=1 Tax=Pseudoroseomonas ludipueritiae TaxID=198093 RepID=A0ABR7RDV1_9PROT|nr:hypothetical protein [Pseudoroseomonas ludipueritiae]MBC9179858.1 hypothetical protein [Pseudoroseomonas ludipueritiae]
MIDPMPVKKQAVEPTSLSSRAGEQQDAAGAPEVKAAQQRGQAPLSGLVLDVHLDGETMRLYTEIRDPETDRVLFRLPAAYQGEDKDNASGASLEA